MKGTIHEKGGLIAHRPTFQGKAPGARELHTQVMPIAELLDQQILELLDSRQAETYQEGKCEGQWFNASKVAYSDLKNFNEENPPHEQPSLVVAIRVSESGSVIRNDRVEAAERTAIAAAEFSKEIDIPLLTYGDIADHSSREKTSLFSYEESKDGFQWLNEKLVTMEPRQNSRDDATLCLATKRLNEQSATTRLLLNTSDGQPKALPDYTGKKTEEDVQSVLKEHERQGILFVSTATGQDKEEVKSICSESRFVDITNLNEFPK